MNFKIKYEMNLPKYWNIIAGASVTSTVYEFYIGAPEVSMIHRVLCVIIGIAIFRYGFTKAVSWAFIVGIIVVATQIAFLLNIC